MKYKMIAAMLALTMMGWAQTATQTSPAPQQSGTTGEKAKCSCCDKMSGDKAETKDAQTCCARHDMKAGEGKNMDSCCNGKDAKSCMQDDKMAPSCKDCCVKGKTAASCCNHGDSKQCGSGCCGSKKSETKA